MRIRSIALSVVTAASLVGGATLSAPAANAGILDDIVNGGANVINGSGQGCSGLETKLNQVKIPKDTYTTGEIRAQLSNLSQAQLWGINGYVDSHQAGLTKEQYLDKIMTAVKQCGYEKKTLLDQAANSSFGSSGKDNDGNSNLPIVLVALAAVAAAAFVAGSGQIPVIALAPVR